MTSPLYNEPVKNKARTLVITSAIKTLTTERHEATLTRRSYVREVREHILSSDNRFDVEQASKLSELTIERWEAFYDSITQSKAAANLKVAYLSGPNPENDLKVFCNAGILPENIWAFESEKSTYFEAVASALESEFKFIKIINGGIDSFLEASPQRFDIIYLDFCGSLSGAKNKTLSTITKILAHHSLNSPGVLITNVCLPTKKQDPVGRNLMSKLVACYLYPKAFLETSESKENFTDGAISSDYDFETWHKIIDENLDEYYGQFITRLVMDHASFISPYDRFPKKNTLFNKFFNTQDQESFKKELQKLFHFDNDYDGGNVIVDSGLHPVLWTIAALDKKTNQKNRNYPQYIFDDIEFNKYSESFISQLNIGGNKDNLIDSIATMTFLMSEIDNRGIYFSESMKKIIKKYRLSDYYQFCDFFLFHQIIELLFRQLAVPYHINTEKTRRWKYQAKQTPMFMDMFVLDECRYLYDWMPTIDMFLSGISDVERQLAYRFALDGVSKHRRWYNPEYFFGTAVVDQYKSGFEAKILKQREIILP
jgi:hypothetical protein